MKNLSIRCYPILDVIRFPMILANFVILSLKKSLLKLPKFF
jgi:hypothetical protein